MEFCWSVGGLVVFATRHGRVSGHRVGFDVCPVSVTIPHARLILGWLWDGGQGSGCVSGPVVFGMDYWVASDLGLQSVQMSKQQNGMVFTTYFSDVIPLSYPIFKCSVFRAVVSRADPGAKPSDLHLEAKRVLKFRKLNRR